MSTPYVSRSGRIIKKPDYYEPKERPEDDFKEDEYDDEDDSGIDEESDDDEVSDEEDSDENGNLKGFVVEDEEEDDIEECD